MQFDITKLFPILLIILNILAGITNLIAKEYKSALYWFFAAGLNITVTF